MSTGEQSYLETVGMTPMVRIQRGLPDAVAANDVRVLVKLEMQNPGGSVKDRLAVALIEDLEKKGQLKPGGTVLEYTSGNTGIGLAMVCAAKGYRCVIVMPQLPFVKERFVICRQFGAEVHLTAPAKGFPGLKEYSEGLLAENPDWICTNQFTSEANPEIHYNTTGPECWAQAGGKVDYFVAGMGTGGTIVGAGKFLKEKNPEMKVIGIEPTESRVTVGENPSPHSILGIGAGVVTHFVEQLEPGRELKEGPRGHIDEFAHASSAEALQWSLHLTKTEGMMVGPTSGAAFKVCMDIAARPEAKGKTIVAILASHGIRYTAHALWADVNAEAATAIPATVNTSKDAPLCLYKPT